VPQGTEHQFWTDGPNAARLMQPAIDNDLQIEVKFDSLLTTQFQEQGIVVEGLGGTFLRFEFYSATGGAIHLFAAIIENNSMVVFDTDTFLSGGLPSYMRVTRFGNQWSHFYSYDGVSWTANDDFLDLTYPMSVTQVGVYAGNAIGGSSPGHTALVDYFSNNASPIESEDGALNAISWNTIGQGNVDLDPDSSNYACYTPVTVTAQADPLWVFDSWSGDLSGSENPETVIMDGPKEVTATFRTDKGRIVVVKETQPEGVEQSFDFTSSYTGTFQLADGESYTSPLLDPGTYSVTESLPACWLLSSATCDDASDPSSIQLDPGETVTCTFVNRLLYFLYLPVILVSTP
jgi:hypothetical protein